MYEKEWILTNNKGGIMKLFSLIMVLVFATGCYVEPTSQAILSIL